MRLGLGVSFQRTKVLQFLIPRTVLKTFHEETKTFPGACFSKAEYRQNRWKVSFDVDDSLKLAEGAVSIFRLNITDV
ncbi:MAG: hypothetical protein CVU64_06995 [Deltaproteobacteria bacterium HGW-Deltaproteobacteria-21]|jgi:hypothetical protein|nr:MAG: hypothetical protein CVU64_06995 [Deltaproteobacteria bacterium HGW-Deltaproteobacteria-21]